MFRNILISIVLFLILLPRVRAEEKPFVTEWKAFSDEEERELILSVKGENYKLNLDIVRRSTLEHPYRKKIYGNYYYGRPFEARLGPQGVESVSLGRFKEESGYYLKHIAQFGAVQWTSMHRAFAHCGALTGNFSDTPDLSRVTDMSEMFLGCNSLTADLSKWEVGTVTNMNSTFRGCTKFTSDLADWNVGKVTDMAGMFQNCPSFNADLSQWKVNQVSRMDSMFLGCSALDTDLSAWKVDKVTNMAYMFANCAKFYSDLSQWNVSKVTDMAGMFQNCPRFNADLSQWKVNQVARMDSMFRGCSIFDTDLSAWKVDKVTNMAYMFANCPKFYSDLSQWNVSKVTDMAGMFQNCPRFNADISGWEVSQVKDMTGMFAGATLFNQDLGHWNLKNCKALSLAKSGMSVENYSKCLLDWAGQDENNIPKKFQLDAAGLHFNEDARTARTKLIQEFGWTIKGDIVEGGEIYPLSIGGIELTSDNVTTLSETLTQKGLLKRGKIAFDAKQKILTLDSVQLETVILSQASKLQIHIVGKCSVKQICTENTNVISNSIVLQGAALTDSLQTQGIQCNKLSIRSCSLDLVLPEKNPLEPRYWLVNNANVHIQGNGKILEDSLLGLYHCAISYPLEAYLGNSVEAIREGDILFQLRRVYVKDALTELRISVTGDIPEDALYIAGKEVSKDNFFKFALLDEITLGEEGYIFYDAPNKTLRMKNVTIEARDRVAIKNLAIDGLCIEVEGDNSIKTNDWGIECKGNTTICGTGKLSIHSKEKEAIALFYTTLTIKGLLHGKYRLYQ